MVIALVSSSFQTDFTLQPISLEVRLVHKLVEHLGSLVYYFIYNEFHLDGEDNGSVYFL